MSGADHLEWPFFEERHRQLATDLEAWALEHLDHEHGPDVDAECRTLVKALGADGWLSHAVGGTAFGGGVTRSSQRRRRDGKRHRLLASGHRHSLR